MTRALRCLRGDGSFGYDEGREAVNVEQVCFEAP